MKLSQTGGEELAYDSPLWTNSDTLNPLSPPETDENAKYASFNTVSFKMMKICIGGPSANCQIFELPQIFTSAKELFSGGHIGIPINRWNALPGISPEVQCNFGFNTECGQHWEISKVRWGWCASRNLQTQTWCGEDPYAVHTMAVIGFGRHVATPGLASGSMGVSWSQSFQSHFTRAPPTVDELKQMVNAMFGGDQGEKRGEPLATGTSSVWLYAIASGSAF